MSRWIALCSRFFGIHLISQVLGFAASLIVVRTLSRHEYSLYTVATTVQITISILADLGLNASVTALGGKVHSDAHSLSRLIATALRIRFVLAGAASLLICPILLTLLRAEGASWTSTLVVTAFSVVGILPQLAMSILLAGAQLRSNFSAMQQVGIANAVIRIASAAFAVLISPTCVAAIAAAALAAYGSYRLAKEVMQGDLDFTAIPDPVHRKALVGLIVKQAPSGVYWAFQGQISIWLISTFGTAGATADVGALQRFGVVFALFSGVLSALAVPAVARCKNRDALLKRYSATLALATMVSAVVSLVAWWFTPQVLSVLGTHYQHLPQAFHLSVICSSLWFITNTMTALNGARGWVRLTWINIPLTIFVQLLAVLHLDLSSPGGIFVFGIATCIPFALVGLASFVDGCALEDRAENPAILSQGVKPAEV